MANAILALNAGSSSIKFGVFEIGPGEPVATVRGTVEENTDGGGRLDARDASGRRLANQVLHPANKGSDGRIPWLLEWIDGHLGSARVVAAGHRIVHGGSDFVSACLLDTPAMAALAALTPLAPLHQPRSLAPVQALKALRPDLPQYGCFDTAFHHGIAPPVSRYAIPRRYEDEGIRRYGFHGLSYEFIASQLGVISPSLPGKRTVVAHLGNGASLCAMRHGRSLDTTMGFSALEGLMMGTRCGTIDPGILLYLQQSQGLSITDLEDLLYRQSGLLGVSGLSGDVRILLASDDPRAKEAIELFVLSLTRAVAVMANTLEGLECLVFTGGIGEHSARIRALTCDRLAWLGVRVDMDANEAGAKEISDPTSAVTVLVLATDEELSIARHVVQIMA